ncbi:MAG: hypothetical protein ACOCYP_04675 [Planctomycetota bacterium]
MSDPASRSAAPRRTGGARVRAAVRTPWALAALLVLGACGEARRSGRDALAPRSRPTAQRRTPQELETLAYDDLIAGLEQVLGPEVELVRNLDGGTILARPASVIDRDDWLLVIQQRQWKRDHPETTWFKQGDTITRSWVWRDRADPDRLILALLDAKGHAHDEPVVAALRRYLDDPRG